MKHVLCKELLIALGSEHEQSGGNMPTEYKNMYMYMYMLRRS